MFFGTLSGRCPNNILAAVPIIGSRKFKRRRSMSAIHTLAKAYAKAMADIWWDNDNGRAQGLEAAFRLNPLTWLQGRNPPCDLSPILRTGQVLTIRTNSAGEYNIIFPEKSPQAIIPMTQAQYEHWGEHDFPFYTD
jgi:hypothetical protein